MKTIIFYTKTWCLSLLFMVAMGLQLIQAQTQDNLTGKVLPKSERLEEGISNFFTELLMREFQGDIKQVKVLRDTEMELKIEIGYEGYANAHIRVEVLDTTQEVISVFSPINKQFTEIDSTLRLKIKLPENLSDRTRFKSAALRIKVAPNARMIPAIVHIFEANKQWQNWIEAQNVIKRIRPVAMGSAKELKLSEAKIKVPAKPIKIYSLPTYQPLLMQQHLQTTPAKAGAGKPKAQTTSTSNKNSAKTKVITSTYQLPRTYSLPGNIYTVPQTNKSSGAQNGKSSHMVKVDTSPKGPSDAPISLWEGLSADVDFEFQQEISDIQFLIYPDQNQKSGVYYYIPAGYTLRWNADEGYDFIISDRGLNGTSGEVYIGSTLTPSMGTQEVNFIKALLEKYVQETNGMVFRKLQPLTLEGQAEVSLDGELALFEIEPENIVPTVSSNMQDPIEIGIRASQKAFSGIDNALRQNIGVRGTIKLNPMGDVMPDLQIPIRIVLADKLTFGRMNLEPGKWRSELWRNKTPFPLKLKYIHYLLINEKSNFAQPIIYSWDLGDVQVNPQERVKFQTSRMPRWLDTYGKAKRIWIDYSVAECDTCMETILQRVLPESKMARSVTFDILPIFEASGASRLRIRMRSPQANPKDQKVTELNNLRIVEDDQLYEMGPLFVAEGEIPSFEYHLSLIMPDGRVFSSKEWKSSNEWEVSIGMYNLRQEIENFPTNITPAQP